MINEIMNEILAAEQKAAQIKTEGEERAAAIAADGEKRRAEVLEEANSRARFLREEILDSYRKKADVEYEATLAESKALGEKLVAESESAARKAAEEIYGRIINGDC